MERGIARLLRNSPGIVARGREYCVIYKTRSRRREYCVICKEPACSRRTPYGAWMGLGRRRRSRHPPVESDFLFYGGRLLGFPVFREGENSPTNFLICLHGGPFRRGQWPPLAVLGASWALGLPRRRKFVGEFSPNWQRLDPNWLRLDPRPLEARLDPNWLRRRKGPEEEEGEDEDEEELPPPHPRAVGLLFASLSP